MNLEIVYHVGYLNLANLENRPLTSYSLEGSGLSVSQHPEEWMEIAQLGGRNLYELKNSNPNFFFFNETNHEKALQWCVENDYLFSGQKYRAYCTDEEGDEYYFEFSSLKKAKRESDDVRVNQGYNFSNKGKSYWSLFCSSPIDNSLAEAYAVIFYAEAHGFDGVWWNEMLDVSAYSAPRGVIFQSQLNNWKIAEL